MHSFKVPENIQVTKPSDGSPLAFVTFKRWFIDTVLSDKRLGFTPAKLARVMTMMGKVTVAEVGQPLELEDADYEACKPAVLEPELVLVLEAQGRQFAGPTISAQLLPFAEAFLGADKK